MTYQDPINYNPFSGKQSDNYDLAGDSAIDNCSHNNCRDPLRDELSRIELINSMGNDLSIVNDARASFAKSSQHLNDKDIKLITYLIKHGHTCYDDKTEVLTKIDGVVKFEYWSKLETLKRKHNIKLASYNNEHGYITFEEPSNWYQSDYEGNMYELTHRDLDLLVTPNHKMLVSLKDNKKDWELRKQNLPRNTDSVWSDYKLIEAKDLYRKTGVRYKTNTESSLGKNPIYPKGQIVRDDYTYGQLIGFFLGDGHAGGTRANGLSFNLRKERKISYVKELCKKLNVNCEQKTSLIVYILEARSFFEQFYTLSSKEKVMPEWVFASNLHFRMGVLDGLRNSDGSEKRSTWCYSTSSEILANQLQILGLITGITFSLNSQDSQLYTLNANSRSFKPRVNEGNNKDNWINYKGRIYCAEVSTGILVVRRNNKVVFSGNSPFRGVVFKFKIKAPLYVCRQWWKHAVASNHNDDQLGWNEQSLRYVSVNDSNEFYVPEVFRQQAKNNKQSTSGELDQHTNEQAIRIYSQQCKDSYNAYTKLLELGVGREQARGVLVPSVYTSWVWTVSYQALLLFIELRTGKGAQDEISAYAEAIKGLIAPIVPVSINAWLDQHH